MATTFYKFKIQILCQITREAGATCDIALDCNYELS